MPPTPLKVLYVNAASERGGAETILLHLIRGLDRRMVSVEVASIGPAPFLAGELGSRNEAFHDTPALRFRDLGSGMATVNRLRSIMAQSRPHVVHCNAMRAHLYGSVAARRQGLPSIYHVHDVPTFTLSPQGLLHVAVASVRTDVAVGVSHYVAERFQGRAKRVMAIPNGIPDHLCQDVDALAVRRELRIPDGHKIVTWCGRLQRWKGPDVFLRAAARVREAFPSVSFIVVGGSLFGLEADYGMMLRSLAGDLGLGEAVAFTGHRDDPHPYMCAADLIVHSSVRPEPFGLVIAEAMTCGKAVVATAAGGPMEIVDPGRTGLLATPGDAGELAGAMIGLLRDDRRRSEMGAAGRVRVRERFGIDRMVSEFQSLYQVVAGK